MLNTAIVEAFHSMKEQKNARAILLRVDSSNQGLTMQKTGFEISTEEALRQIPLDEAALILLWFEYDNYEKPPVRTDKFILIHWCPEGTPLKKKMAVMRSLEELKSLGGIAKTVASTDYSEVRTTCLA